MKIKYWLFISLFSYIVFLYSCSPKLPVQSVSLMQQILDETQRMHKLNMAFVNKIFTEKTEQVNRFIDEEYTPDLIQNIKNQIAGKNVDMNKEWPTVMQKLAPVINGTKDSLQKVLVDNRIKIVTKLNADYNILQQACEEEINLMSSAVKLNEANRQIIDGLIKKISNDKIDGTKLAFALDNFLKKGSSITTMILDFQNTIGTLFPNL